MIESTDIQLAAAGTGTRDRVGRIWLCVALLLFAGTACVVREPRDREEEKLADLLGMDEVPEGLTYQAWFGLTQLDEEDQDFERTSSFDPTVSASPEFSNMPLIGIAVQQDVVGDQIAAGAEGGVTLGWWFDRESARNNTGALLLEVDSELLMLEFFFGGFVSADLGDAARIYAGAGPLLYLGIYDTEIEEQDPAIGTIYEDDETDAALGAGAYARAGFDLFFDDDSAVGIGVRQVIADLDFGSPSGEIDFDGVQVFLTWTLRF